MTARGRSWATFLAAAGVLALAYLAGLKTAPSALALAYLARAAADVAPGVTLSPIAAFSVPAHSACGVAGPAGRADGRRHGPCL